MLHDIRKTVVLGGSGQMASLFLPYLPNPVALVDTKNINADVLILNSNIKRSTRGFQRP